MAGISRSRTGTQPDRESGNIIISRDTYVNHDPVANTDLDGLDHSHADGHTDTNDHNDTHHYDAHADGDTDSKH